MDESIYKKMKVKPGTSALCINAPEGYPQNDDLTWAQTGPAGFVHLFVQNQAQFMRDFQNAVHALEKDGLFWLSYPKQAGKQKYDINRDSLWDLVLPHGWHPVAQVSLDDTWSAIRLKPNEPGKDYKRPGA